jgi:hypothetical protein
MQRCTPGFLPARVLLVCVRLRARLSYCAPCNTGCSLLSWVMQLRMRCTQHACCWAVGVSLAVAQGPCREESCSCGYMYIYAGLAWLVRSLPHALFMHHVHAMLRSSEESRQAGHTARDCVHLAHTRQAAQLPTNDLMAIAHLAVTCWLHVAGISLQAGFMLLGTLCAWCHSCIVGLGNKLLGLAPISVAVA